MQATEESAASCFHCALPIPAGTDYSVDTGDAVRPACCPGCKAVAELILASGMQNYYKLREAPFPGSGRPEADDGEWAVFNGPEMLRAFVERQNGDAIASIHVAGMYCAACSWLIDTALSRTDGISDTQIDPVTHRLRVQFDPQKLGLGDVLATLAGLGYKPQALTPESTDRPELLEQRSALKRLLIASIGMMQVMMFAVALYAGDFQGIDDKMQRFLRLVSFLVTTPVVFYAARPFFAAAVRGLRARQPGMDLPVSIAIGSAYVASVYATLTNGPAVWYDSVTMFVFFLTLGRFLEMRARHRSIDRKLALAALLPNTVVLLDDAGHRTVPTNQLVAGDCVLIRPGDAIPADGAVLRGETTVNEAVLTGESRPRIKRPGDTLVAGSQNIDGAIELVVQATGIDTTLGAIGRLSERARYARPAFVKVADRVASYIVIAILIIAIGVALAWALFDPSRAFVVTLSVLVVTCPCALALATPAAFAAANSRLSELQLLVTNGDAVETLARADHFIFDKTGTLTLGLPVIVRSEIFDANFSNDECLGIARALETHSTHPIAAAFREGPDRYDASDCLNIVGAGVSGTINGQKWRLGKREFVAGMSAPDESSGMTVWLGKNDSIVAKFGLDDELRPDAAETLAALKDMGIALTILSGDSAAPVQRVADMLSIDTRHHSATPVDKLDLIRQRQQLGECVVMIGDGINDAPVLAGADASIAPAHASTLAQTSADIIMLGDSLRPVGVAARMSRQTMRVVRQNIVWAIVYNATALPLAAFGYVPPWLAAIGMSMSSLVVVLNALRLGRFQ